MENYRCNPRCDCGRCRMAGLMGPAVLITLGALFLIGEFSHFPFHRSWPVLLLVIGIVKLLQYTAPIDGHIPVQMYVPAPVVAPPPAPPSGNVPPEQHGSQNQGVNNG
jgi:hypothetical protein